MKVVLAVVLVALVASATAQTKCSIIMDSLAAASSSVNTEQGMLVAVVDASVTAILNDTGVARYFLGQNGFPDYTGAPAVAALKSKLIGWFSGYLGCVNTDPAPYNETQLSLTASHAALRISYRDARAFNGRVLGAIAAVLASQNVDFTNANLLAVVTNVTADLEAVIPTYAVNPTGTFCDKYANLVGSAFLQNSSIFGSTIGPVYNADFSKGTGWAFWRLFVDFLVIKQGIAANPTGVPAVTLLPFFGSVLPPDSAAYNTLVNKLVAWFGKATGCSDQDFNVRARATGAVNSTNQPVDLTASHQPLFINATVAGIFNNVILTAAGSALTPFGLTSGEVTVVTNLLNSVNSQVIRQGAAPTAPVPPAAAPTGAQAPRAAPTTAAPKSSAAGVFASGLVVAASAIFALMF